MYSSPSVSKRFVLIPIFVVVVTQLLMHSVSSLNMTNAYLHHKCLVSQGKYKPGSQEEKDHNEIIEKLSKVKRSFNTGFGMMAFGSEPERVSVIFQCRGDSYGSKCHSCFATAQSELRKRCPRDNGGVIWHDQCLVEFSSLDTVGQINYDDGFCMPSAKNISGDPLSNLIQLRTLISNLTKIAITKENINLNGIKKPALYAAGEKRLGKKKLYVMVQCMLDLTVQACEECMSYIIVNFHKCYSDKQGARVMGKSCNFRFELYPFVDAKTSPNYSKF